MGLLVNGEWKDQWYETEDNQGEFKREASQLRNWITPEGEFPAESGRYHLYVSLACPWAHRTLIFRKLKQLENHISISIVSPDMLDQGWSFDKNNHSTGDDLYHFDYLHQLYTKNNSTYTGRVTVPILWDKKLKKIINNESAEIIRMFNSAFNKITNNNTDFYPEKYQNKIDQINNTIYEKINNGVYRCGFATEQAAYEHAYEELFNTLDWLEDLFSKQEFLINNTITEADWRLFTTLIRFDSVYYSHFKCNKKRIEDYPHLATYLRKLYQWPGVADTVDFYHIKRHYYYSHTMINPTQIVPLGPEIDYSKKI